MVHGTTLFHNIAQRGAEEQIEKQHIMNKYIEEYISQRKREILEEEQLAKQAEKEDILEKLHLGDREYQSDFPDEPENNFPCYDSVRNEYYRYYLGEVSDDDYLELLKYIPKEDKPKVTSSKKMSGWYTFAIVMLILCCSGTLIGGIVEEYPFLTIIAAILGSLIFFSQIILLCKIEYNTRAEE